MRNFRLLVGIPVWVLCAGPAIACAAEPTRVVLVSPRDKAANVGVQTLVQIHFSNGLQLKTITDDAVRLLNPAGQPVDARLGSDIEGDVVNLQPTASLALKTTYSVEVNGKLIDKEGSPVAGFRSSFTTGADVPRPASSDGFRYAKTKAADVHGPTAIAVGPDGNVYVSTYDGILYRLRIDPETGLPIGKEELLQVQGKKILGLAFEPAAKTADLIAWITYDDRKAELQNEGTFSGVLSKVQIPAVGSAAQPADRIAAQPAARITAQETPYIVGLPSGWHPLNGCTFGPDQRIFISVGSMNRLGDDPVRPETPLSSAVVVADVLSLMFNGGRVPLNVQTTAPVNYDPQAVAAPLKLYATGFRQMYRVCWHSSGNLYGGVNQNDGTGRSDTPSKPGVPALHSVFPDEDLVRIVEDGYYGHPNPSRNQIVLLGGNPTAEVDPWEVPEYPVGIQPEPNFNSANLIFNLKTINGTSANGCAEYTLPGPLQGRLLICFYEGTHTVHTFAFNKEGTAVTDNRPLLSEKGESLTFTQPLDVAVHPTGRIYVADFGAWSSFGQGGAIWCLSGK